VRRITRARVGRGLWLVAGVAAAARLAYWALVTPSWKPDSDADQYVRLARALGHGDGFALQYPQLEVHATAFRPPLYPALLSVVSWTDALWPARLLSVALGTGVVVLAAVLGQRIGGARAGLCAGLVVALYPPLLANDTITLTEPLSLLLVLGLVLLMDDSHWLWAAALAGALVLTRPNAYLVVALVVFVAFRRAGAKTALLTGAVVLVAVVPWSIRNVVQVGTPRLVTSDAFTLAAVFAPAAQRAEGFVDPAFSHAYDDDLELRLSQFDEPEWDDKLTDRALDGLRDNPEYLVENAARNGLRFLELKPSENDSPESIDGRNLDFRHATLPFFYVVTIAGVIGLWRDRRDARVQWLAVIVAQFALLSVLIVSPPRLRAPFDLACAIGAGLLVDAFMRTRRGATAVAA
jgi:hypothetical protein